MAAIGDLERLDLENCQPVQCAALAMAMMDRCAPDVMLCLGDRFEILGAAYAATHNRVPIAHIHGGEATHGCFDDHIRHAITKLSHLHFVAHPEYERRVRQLGERNVWCVGAPGLDNLTDLPPRVPDKYFVITYHPVTLGKQSDIHALLSALERFPDYRMIFTGVNNDPGHVEIRNAIENWNTKGVEFVINSEMTPREYHLLCRNAAVMVGNSSSGIIEAPTLEVPSVDIGERQTGRIIGQSVQLAQEQADSIANAINRALTYTGSFRNPYGGPGASKMIADVLLSHPLDDILVKPWSW